MSAAIAPTAIFDLDGTLVDSAPDLADCLDATLVDQGLRPIGEAHARRLIGHGIPALVAAGLDAAGAPPDAALAERALARFLALYAERLALRTRPYPGAAEALAAMHGAGWRLVVCTNKAERFACAMLDALGLRPHLDAVIGPERFGAAKPDPRPLLGALPAADARAVVVGDSEIDVAAARAAGLPVVAVAWGYARVPVAALGADAVAARFGEIPALAERLAAPARDPNCAPSTGAAAIASPAARLR